MPRHAVAASSPTPPTSTGRPPAVDLDDDELAALDDTAAVLLAFPWLTDAELVEALWALARTSESFKMV